MSAMMHEGITTVPVTIASVIGKFNKKENYGFFDPIPTAERNL
jgi:hypothetical protein